MKLFVAEQCCFIFHVLRFLQVPIFFSLPFLSFAGLWIFGKANGRNQDRNLHSALPTVGVVVVVGWLVGWLGGGLGGWVGVGWGLGGGWVGLGWVVGGKGWEGVVEWGMGNWEWRMGVVVVVVVRGGQEEGGREECVCLCVGGGVCGFRWVWVCLVDWSACSSLVQRSVVRGRHFRDVFAKVT